MFMEKIKRDSHMHSHYCTHGCDDSMEKYIENAISRGLEEITITEHLPMLDGVFDEENSTDPGMRMEDIEKYMEEVAFLKNRYKDRIKINLGLEVDYIEGFEEETKKLLDKYGRYLDDSIISAHIVKLDGGYYPIDYSIDKFAGLIEMAGSLEALYRKYYETVMKLVQADLGDYKPKRIGHLNLIRKYNQRFPFDYSEMPELEKLVKNIKDGGYELDFNVSGLRKPYCGEEYIHGKLLELVNENGIKLVFGSDSHEAEFVGIRYPEAK